MRVANPSFSANHTGDASPEPRVLSTSPLRIWWRGVDSNHRRRSRQIYSLIPLAAREPLRERKRRILLERPSTVNGESSEISLKYGHLAGVTAMPGVGPLRPMSGSGLAQRAMVPTEGLEPPTY